VSCPRSSMPWFPSIGRYGKAIPTGLTIGPDMSEIDTRPSNGAAAPLSIATLRPAATVDPHVAESGHPGMATFAACSTFTVFGAPKEAPCAVMGDFLPLPHPRRRTGFAQKAKPRRFITKIYLCGDPSGMAFSRSYESSLGIVCRCFQGNA
jgi:hypothetical protein